MKKILLSLVASLLGTLAFAQVTLNTTVGSTGYTGSNGCGSGSAGTCFTTFVVQNTSTSPIQITEVGQWTTTSNNANTVALYSSTTSLGGTVTGAFSPTAPPAGWSLAATGTISGITTTGVNTVLSGLNIVVPGGTTIRFALLPSGTVSYSGTGVGTASPNTFSSNGVNLLVGDVQLGGGYVGLGGVNNPRFFTGSVTYVPLTPCAGAPTGGTTNTTATAVCPLQNFGLSLGGATLAAGISYQWETSSTGTGSWTPIAGATFSTYTASQTVDTYYRCALTCSNSSLTSYSTTVQVTTLPNLAAGTYTVGPTGTYPNLTAAFAAASCGVAGPVVFNIQPFSGPYTEQIILGEIPGMSATNTITIEGNGNTLQFTSFNTNERAVLKLNGTDFLTVKNLNIRAIGKNTAAPIQYGYGVHLMNGANNNTFKNCTVQATDSVTSLNFGGFICSNTANSATGIGLAASNLLIDSCTIVGGYYGLTLGGISGTTVGLPSNNVVKNTVIRDFYLYGAYTRGQNNLLFKNNTINRATRAGTVSTFYGLYTTGRHIGSRFDGNKIHNPEGNFPATSTTTYPIYGSSTVGRGNAPVVFCNNVIYNIRNNAGTQAGMYLLSLDSAQILNNTIALDNDLATGASLTYGIYISGLAAQVVVRNNAIHIGSANTGIKYMLYYGTSTAVPNSNNNVFDFTGAGGTSQNIGFLSNAKATLANWQASSGTPDLASQVTVPLFTSASTGNLMPQSGALNNNGANTLQYVPTDILGVARTATPDIGAYEFTPTGCTPPTLSLLTNAGGTATISVTSIVTTPLYQYEYGPCGFTQGTGTIGTLTGNGTISVTGLLPNTCYQVFVRTDCGTITGTSMWIPIQFTTPCASGTMPYLEQFTTFPVQCWTQSGTQNWMHYTTGNPSLRANFWSWASGNNAIYSTQPITISTAATVGFKWSHQFNTNYPLDQFILRARKVGTTAWDTLFNKVGPTFNTTGGGTTVPGTFKTELIYLPASYVGGDVVFELRGNSGFGPDLFIDDFEVKQVPSCPDPVLVSTNKTSNSVSLSWANVPGIAPLKSKIIWGPAGFLSGTGVSGTVVNQINSPYTVTGLQPNTLYDFYVQDSCGTSFSNVVGPLTVKTNCVTSLNGTYTVNGALPAAGFNFQALDSAMQYVSACGITGPVTFNLAAGSYTGEFTLTDIPGSSPVNTVTINGGTAGLATITAPLGTASVFTLNGARNIALKNLRMINTAGGVVRFLSNADSNVVENNIIISDTTGTAVSAAVFSSGSTTSPTTLGSDVDYITIKNNVIKGAYYGIALGGISTTVYDKGFLIEGNTLLKQYYYGMRLYGLEDMVIKNNRFDQSRITSSYGMYVYYTRNVDIEGNFMNAQGYGLYLYYPNFQITGAIPSNRIVNNMLKGNTYGFYSYSLRDYQFYHNTCVGGTYGYYLSGSTVAGQEIRNLDTRNNIFTGNTYPFYQVTAFTTAQNSQLDYNAYQAGTSGLAYYGAARATLAAWQTAFPALNSNSVAGTVIFNSPSDFHVVGSFPNDLGVNGLGVNTDIDGQVRPAAGSTAPDMGADEFTPIANDAKLISILGAKGGCGDSTTTLSLVFENFGLNPIVTMPGTIQVTQPSGATVNLTASFSGSLLPLSRDTLTVGSINTYAGGTWDFKGYTSLANDGRTSNDTTSLVGVNFLPFEPVTMGLVDSVCPGVDSVLLAAIPVPGTVYGWYGSATDTVKLAEGNTFKVATSGQNSYFVQYLNTADSAQAPLTGGNSTTGGNMFNIINTSGGPLTITGFAQGPGAVNSALSNVAMIVHYTPGDYLTQPTASWVQLASGNVSLSPNSCTGYLPVSVTIPTGATYGFFVGLVSNSVQYTTGTGTPGVTPWFTNNDMVITQGRGGTFPNPAFSPRNWNGKVYYGTVGCSEIRKEVAFVVSTDTAKAVIASATQTAPGQFNFASTGSNGHLYQWTFGNGLTASGPTASTTYASGGAFTVTLVVTDTVCGTMDSATFTVNSTIGLDENTLGQNVYAFPNPSNGQVAIVLEGNEAFQGRMEIINSVGQVVVARSVETAAGRNEFPMDLRDLAKGVYTVRVASEAGQRQIRLVLQ
ncbi:MAG: right-handed parallel beta-helix repeat-containing protein [Schleiferiaceae bacterium]|nr:right-handed parallel beta-helix repeat-containing protein [Schleiferiaceae bacterium]